MPMGMILFFIFILNQSFFSLIDTLPIFLRQFTYLVCKSLRNLARQSSGNIIDSYTGKFGFSFKKRPFLDLLLLFTPILFPNSVGDVSRFLRATRISLILVDLCDTVFRPFLSLPMDSSIDSAYHSDEDFFRDIVESLNNLQEEFDSEEEADSVLSVSTEEIDGFSTPNIIGNGSKYYQITYVDGQ